MEDLILSKVCNKCLLKKEISLFCRHKKAKDGHNTICKICVQKRREEYRKENREHVRALEREYVERGIKKNDPLYHKNYREKYPKKFKAKVMILNAINRGAMKRETICSKCNCSGLIHAHHDDYNYPLSVRWLCPLCHAAWHKENGEGKNST